MELTLQQARVLHEIALVLENDSCLHKSFTGGLYARCGLRAKIVDAAQSSRLRPLPVAKPGDSNVLIEMLRRHLCKHWGVKPVHSEFDDSLLLRVADEAGLPIVEPDSPDADCYFTQVRKAKKASTHSSPPQESDVALSINFNDPIDTKKEPTMTKPTIIEITTKTLINGVDISTYSDAQIYEIIAEQEQVIVKLEQINAKPKKLVAEIEKRRDGIKALVDYLDSKE